MKKNYLFLIFIVLYIYNACDLEVITENKIPTSPILKYPNNKAINIKLDTILNWITSTDEDGNALKYDVFFDIVNPPLKKIVYFLNDSSFLPVLQPNTTYYWRVVVNDGKGGMAKSDVWSFTTIPSVNILKNHNPSVPALIYPLNKSTNNPLKILLEWSPSKDEDGESVNYEVMFGTDFPPNVPLTTIQTTSTLSPALRQNTKYYWQIITTDGKGGINQSEIRSFTTVKNITSNPPKIPILLSPLNNSINIPLNQIINWNTSYDPDGDVVKYNVLFSTSNPPSTLISTLQPDTFFIPQLIYNTTYYWKIIAIDANNFINESEIRTFKTIYDPLTAITLFSPPNNETKIKLNEILKWNEWKTTSGGSVKYTVYFDTEINPVAKVSIDQTVTTFTPTLLANTIYYWKVTANDGIGNTNESEIWKFTTVSNPPPKPILISPSNNATNLSLSQILKWEKVIDGNNIIKYNVLLGTASPPTKIVSTLQTLDTFTASLSGNKTYFWQIVADNGNGGITESDIWSFTTLNNDPSKPNLISPKNQATDKNIDDTLKWDISTDPDGDIINYTVFLGTTNPPTTKVASSILDTFFIPSLFGNTTYYWKIIAEDAFGGKTESDVSSFKTKLIIPTVPSLISPDNNAINIILNSKLTWNSCTTSSGKVANYDVFLCTSNPPTIKVSTLQTETSYTFSSLLPNTIYYWKIVANDGNGGESISEIRNFKTIIPPSIPVLISPENLDIDISINSHLTWNVSTTTSSNDIKYKVFLDTSSTFSSSVKVESNLQTGTFYILTNLLSNTNYYWKISAVDGNGLMTESEVRTFKSILVPPSVPTLIYPLNNGILDAVFIRLKWNKCISSSGKDIKYDVYIDTLSTPVNKVSSLQIDTFYNTTKLNTNKTYYWKIVANDGNGGESTSEIRIFKTKVPPEVPILISPLNLATDLNLNTNLLWNVSKSSANIVKYDVFLDTLKTPEAKVSDLQLGTSYSATSLFSNTDYYWNIVAVDENGLTAESETRTFKTLLVPPSDVVLTSPVNSENNVNINADLVWDASTGSSGKVVKYNVYLDTLNPPVKNVSSLQTGTSFTTSLLSNKVYYWKIEADDGNEGIIVSEIRTFKTKIVPPSVPTLTYPLLNGVVDTLVVDLKWNACTSSSGKTIKYDVLFDTLSIPISKVSDLQVGTTYTTPNLIVNKTYYWKIVADDDNGGISESEIRSFNTLTLALDNINVEGGTFTMGCTHEQGGYCKSVEKPTRSVNLSNFSIGKYEVTQFQWVSVMGSNPSKYPGCNDCPVGNVSWDDVQTFLTTLNTNTGKNYRLPTEAEWEYAARGGKNSKGYRYSGSNDSSAVAWYYYSGSKPHIVGTKMPNELGIYDMSGNMFEWVSDWFGDYSGISETNPTGPITGTKKVLRSGSYIDGNGPTITRVSFRTYSNKDSRLSDTGFRIVLP